MARSSNVAWPETESEAALRVVTPAIDHKQHRDNKEERKRAWRVVFRQRSKDGLRIFYDALSVVRRRVGRVQSLDSHAKIVALMAEALAEKTVTEGVEARRDQIKDLVCDYITARHVDNDHPDPENVNGHIDVPEYGKRFVREGCGWTDALVDFDELKKHVTTEEWESFTERRVIVVPDPARFADFMSRHPERATELKAKAMIPRQPKTPRFTIRDMKERYDDEY